MLSQHLYVVNVVVEVLFLLAKEKKKREI